MIAPRDPPPLIIEAALNGGSSKRDNPNVPHTSAELAADGLRCLRAGASVIHTHAPDPYAPPEQAVDLYLAHFRPILDAVPDALVYPTTVFDAPVEQRVGHLPLLVRACGLRIGLMEPGSGNFGPSDEQGLPLDSDRVYTNTPRDVRYMAELCARHRLGPSMVIFEPGFLRCALAYERAGQLPQGAFLRLTLCGERSYRGPGRVDLLCGLPNTPSALDAYLEMLGDSSMAWAVSVVSGDVFERGVARHAVERGGHLRVGLEDYAGGDAPHNEELVGRAVELAAEVGRPVASPTQAALALDLPVPARQVRA
jgi:uncharacterized protein (DUF849 family)